MSVKIVMGEEKLVFSPPINEETKKCVIIVVYSYYGGEYARRGSTENPKRG